MKHFHVFGFVLVSIAVTACAEKSYTVQSAKEIDPSIERILIGSIEYMFFTPKDLEGGFETSNLVATYEPKAILSVKERGAFSDFFALVQMKGKQTHFSVRAKDTPLFLRGINMNAYTSDGVDNFMTLRFDYLVPAKTAQCEYVGKIVIRPPMNGYFEAVVIDEFKKFSKEKERLGCQTLKKNLIIPVPPL